MTFPLVWLIYNQTCNYVHVVVHSVNRVNFVPIRSLLSHPLCVSLSLTGRRIQVLAMAIASSSSNLSDNFPGRSVSRSRKRSRSKRVLAEEPLSLNPHHTRSRCATTRSSTAQGDLDFDRNDCASRGGDSDGDDILCQACGLGDRENHLLLCDNCDKGHHSFCLRPILFRVPSGPWLCPSCSCLPRHHSITGSARKFLYFICIYYIKSEHFLSSELN